MAKQKTDLAGIRQALGVGPEVPDSDIQALLGTKKGKAELKQVEAGPKSMSAFDLGLEGLMRHWQSSEAPLSHIVDWVTSSLHQPTQPAEAAPKGKGKGKAPTGGNLPSATAAAQSPFTELAQQLAQTYLQQVQQLQSLTSGAATPGLEATATTGAEAALKGLGVGGAAQQFLANTPTDPMAGQLEASQKALGNAQAAGAIPYSEAIAGTGPANTAGLQAAPYSQILNELANAAAYRASSPSYGASAFGATTANMPPSLQYIFNALGLPVPKPGQGSASNPSGGLTAPTNAAKGGAGSTTSTTQSQPIGTP